VSLSIGLASALLAMSALSACTSDDGDQEDSGAVEPQTPAATATALDVQVARVAGSLKQAKRDRLAADVEATIQQYVDDAFLGDYPRSDFAGAFSTFTRGAAEEAARDAELISGAAYSGAESATADALQARLSVLAPGGRAAGVTAKVRFAFDYDETRVTYSGRLLLTPAQGTWRIFGYDLKRDDQPTGATS